VRGEGVVEFTDLVIYVLKQMGSRKCNTLTGVPNELIIENLRRLEA